MKAGLYFSKTSNILFNKDSNIKYLNNETVKLSDEGIRYIEDGNISPIIKNKLSNIPFIKELAKNFDTFLHFHETPKGSRPYQSEHVSYIKVS